MLINANSPSVSHNLLSMFIVKTKRGKTHLLEGNFKFVNFILHSNWIIFDLISSNKANDTKMLQLVKITPYLPPSHYHNIGIIWLNIK